MILTLSLLTIFLACIAIYFNWNRNNAVLLFAGFIITYSLLVLTHQVIVYQGDELLFAIFYNHFTPLYYLSGPFLYLFIRSLVRDELKFTSFDLIHLLPAVLTLIGIFPYLFTPFSEKLEIARAVNADFNVYKEIRPNWLIPVDVNNVMRPLLMISYCVASLVFLLKNSPSRLSHSSQDQVSSTVTMQYQQTRSWAILVIIAVLLTSASYFITLYYFLVDGYEAALKNGFIWQMISAALYIVLPTSLLLFPNLMYGFIRIGRGEVERAVAASRATVVSASKATDGADGADGAEVKLETSPTEPIPQELITLKKAILTYIENEEPFLQKDFKAHDVALYLNVPAHHISYCFSVCFEESFSQLKTRYRIDYAIRLLKEGVAGEMTIEAIGQQAGFASKSSFFTAFKESTGVTPQQYLSEVPRGVSA